MINTSRSRIIVIVTLALALVAAIIAIGLGSVYIPIPDILSTIFGSAAKAVNATIIWDIRLPRVLLAMIIGANIAVSGALLQAVMGNPLADPGLTGVTSAERLHVCLSLCLQLHNIRSSFQLRLLWVD